MARGTVPAASVEAPTEAGHLAAPIPAGDGGARPPLSGFAAILDQAQRQGCDAAARHARTEVTGTLQPRSR